MALASLALPVSRFQDEANVMFAGNGRRRQLACSMFEISTLCQCSLKPGNCAFICSFVGTSITSSTVPWTTSIVRQISVELLCLIAFVGIALKGNKPHAGQITTLNEALLETLCGAETVPCADLHVALVRRICGKLFQKCAQRAWFPRL